MNDCLIKAHQISFSYPNQTPLFENLSFELKSGEILAILGPNGSGKSTLLNLLSKTLHPTCGDLYLPNLCGVVPQFFYTPFLYSVLDIVLLGRAPHLKMFQTPSSKDFEYADKVLCELQISHLKHQNFNDLSGGQKQLVLIAQAMATQAPLLILDEPTSALDLHFQNQVLNLLQTLAKENNLSIIFTTHQPEFADLIADYTMLMFPKNIQFGKTKEMLTPSNLHSLFLLPILKQSLHNLDIEHQQIIPLYDAIFKKPH